MSRRPVNELEQVRVDFPYWWYIAFLGDLHEQIAHLFQRFCLLVLDKILQFHRTHRLEQVD